MNIRNLFKKRQPLSEISSAVDKFSLQNAQKLEYIILTNGITLDDINRDYGRLFFVVYNEMFISQSFDITLGKGKCEIFSDYYRTYIQRQLSNNSYIVESNTFYNLADDVVENINYALFYNKTNTVSDNPAARLSLVYLKYAVPAITDFDQNIIDKVSNALESLVVERNNLVYSINF